MFPIAKIFYSLGVNTLGAGLWSIVLAGALSAQNILTPPLNCVGDSPQWEMDILDNQAFFNFLSRRIIFDIADETLAEGRDWPRALTLLARDDTAIVVLRSGRGAKGFDIDVLTQRRGLPVLLTGQCTQTP